MNMWTDYFKRERAIKTLAARVGIPKRRAAALAQGLASSPARAHALLARVGTPGVNDVPVVRAHRLLARLEPTMTPPLDSIRVLPLLSMLPLQEHAGCLIAGKIFVSPTSQFYQAATNGGDATALALILHHEYFHAVHRGATEAEVMAGIDTIRATARERGPGGGD